MSVIGSVVPRGFSPWVAGGVAQEHNGGDPGQEPLGHELTPQAPADDVGTLTEPYQHKPLVRARPGFGDEQTDERASTLVAAVPVRPGIGEVGDTQACQTPRRASDPQLGFDAVGDTRHCGAHAAMDRVKTLTGTPHADESHVSAFTPCALGCRWPQG